MVTGSSIARNLKNLPTILQHFCLHYACKIKFFAQVVTNAFSDKPKGKPDNSRHCDVTKSKSRCEHDVT